MRKICALLGLVVGAVVVLSARPAQAIPPFAREYGVPCSTCHITITRRTEFGDAFRRAGYRWPTKLGADNEGRPMAPVEMRGATLADGLLPARSPIGLVTLLGANFTTADLPHQASFANPSVSLVYGSNLGKNVSLFAILGSSGTPGEIVAHFSRLGGRRELNLRVGNIEATTTLFKTNEQLLANYMIGSASPTGHAMQSARVGAELNGVVAERFFYALGAVQNAGPQTPIDGYYHVGMKLGGMTYSGIEPDVDFDHPAFFDEASIAVAHWGYLGTVEDSGKDAALIRRYGFDLQFNLPFGQLWGGVMLGFDRDLTQLGPTLPANGLKNKSVTWFVEPTYRFTSWLSASYIYQFHDAATIISKPIQTHDAGLIALLMDNLRLRLKFKATADDVDNETVDLQALIGF